MRTLTVEGLDFGYRLLGDSWGQESTGDITMSPGFLEGDVRGLPALGDYGHAKAGARSIVRGSPQLKAIVVLQLSVS